MCCDSTCCVSSVDAVVNNDVTLKLTKRLTSSGFMPSVFGQTLQYL